MNYPICDSCETVKHCSQHGCVPKQPLKPCRSPYCECVPGTCSHPGCYDARSEPFEHPAPVQEPVAIEELTDIFHKAWQKDFKESVLGGMSTGSEELKGQWREHVKTGIIALLAAQSPPTVQEPVAHLWQHSQTGRTRIVMPGGIITADAAWFVVGPLVLGNTTAPAAQPAPVQEQIADPCPGCTPGHVCRTPACGRLQLPQSHPLRNKP